MAQGQHMRQAFKVFIPDKVTHSHSILSVIPSALL